MSEREPVRAMILAAGRGTRLRPLTDTVPKPLVEVAGRRLIDYALDTVARSGIRDVVINVHHFADAVRAAVGDGGDRGLHVEFSVETELLDSGGGILAARPLLGGATVVTLNADTIVDVDLGELVRWHRRRAAIATLLLREDASAADYGLIGTDDDGLVVEFLDHRRPHRAPALHKMMYTGVQVLEPTVYDSMPSGGAFSITRDTYPRLLAADLPVFGRRFDGRWITVGTPDELAAAEARLSAPAEVGNGSVAAKR